MSERPHHNDADDPTTRRLIEGVLAVEEEHADELADLLAVLPEAREAGSERATVERSSIPA